MDIRTISVGFNPLPIQQQSANMSERQLGIHRPRLGRIRKTIQDITKHIPTNVCSIYNHLITENNIKGTVTRKVTGLHKHDGMLPYDNPKHGMLPLYHVQAKLELRESRDTQYFSNLKYKGSSVANWVNWPTVSNIMNGIHFNPRDKHDPFPKAVRAYFMHTISEMTPTFSAGTLKKGPELITSIIKAEKPEPKIPWIHVNEFGPPMYFTFHKDTVHVFECVFNSRPTNFIDEKTCRVWVGPLIPKTLCKTSGCNLDLAFGILVQAENKNEFFNVMSIVMTPASLAVVKVDWGSPYDQEIVKFKKSVYTDAISSSKHFSFDLKDIKSFELINDYRHIQGLNTNNKLWESRLQYGVSVLVPDGLAHIEERIIQHLNSVKITEQVDNFILENMPMEFTRQFIPVVGIDIDTDTRHAYQCCVGSFVRAAVKQNFLTQIYRNMVYAMLSQLMLAEYEDARFNPDMQQERAFPATRMSTFDDLREVYTAIRELRGTTDKNGVLHTNLYDVNYDAHRMLSSLLYESSIELSPSGFGVNKFMKYSNERTLLFKLMVLFFRLYYIFARHEIKAQGDYQNEHITTDLESWKSEHFQIFRNIFSTIERAVDVSMGNEYVRSDMQKEREGMYDFNRTPMSAGILHFVSMVGTLKHKMNSYTNTELHEFCLEEYVQPCTIREISMPVVLPTICNNVDLSDILHYSRLLFDMYKSYYPYNPSTYPPENDSQHMSMPFQQEDVCIRDRKFLMKSNKILGADLVTSENSLFVRLMIDLDTKKLSMALMYPYASASKTIVPVEAKGYHPGHARHPSNLMKNTMDKVSTEHIKEVPRDQQVNRESFLSSGRVAGMMQYSANLFKDKLSEYGSGFKLNDVLDLTSLSCKYSTACYDCTTEFMWECRDLSEANEKRQGSLIEYKIVVSAFSRAPIYCNGSEQLAWDLRYTARVTRKPSMITDADVPNVRTSVLFPDEFTDSNTEQTIKKFGQGIVKEVLGMLLECSSMHHTSALTPYEHNAQPSKFIAPAYHYMLEFIDSLSNDLKNKFQTSITHSNPSLRHFVSSNPLDVSVSYHDVVDNKEIQKHFKVLVKINPNNACLYFQHEKHDKEKIIMDDENTNTLNRKKLQLTEDDVISHEKCDTKLKYFMKKIHDKVKRFIESKDEQIAERSSDAPRDNQYHNMDSETAAEMVRLVAKDLSDHFTHDCETPYISVKATSWESTSNSAAVGAKVTEIQDSIIPMMYHGKDHIVIQKKDQIIQAKFVRLEGSGGHWMLAVNCFNKDGEMSGPNLRHKTIIANQLRNFDKTIYKNRLFTLLENAARALGWKTTKYTQPTESSTLAHGALRLILPRRPIDTVATKSAYTVVIPRKPPTTITTIPPPNDPINSGTADTKRVMDDPRRTIKAQYRTGTPHETNDMERDEKGHPPPQTNGARGRPQDRAGESIDRQGVRSSSSKRGLDDDEEQQGNKRSSRKNSPERGRQDIRVTGGRSRSESEKRRREEENDELPDPKLIKPSDENDVTPTDTQRTSRRFQPRTERKANRPQSSPAKPEDYTSGPSSPGNHRGDGVVSDSEGGYASDSGTIDPKENRVQPFRPPESPPREAWGEGGEVSGQGNATASHATLDLDDVLARLSLSI